MKKIVFWHIGAWVLFLSFFLFPVFLGGFTSRMLFVLISFLLYISVFYINLFVILPLWIKKRKIIILLVSWAALIFVYTLLSVALNHVLHVFDKNGNVRLELLNAFLRNFLFVSIFLFASTAYQSITDWFKNEKIKEQLENQNLKTELAFLKSQINPHFLFNTLNNIYILAYQGSKETAEAILKLSDMMRYMLYESSDEFVPLEKEIEYIGQLISLQQLRMKEKSCLEFYTNGSTAEKVIAPLILIAFVENIFKHAVLNNPEDHARVEISIENNILTFRSRNRMLSGTNKSQTGIGLQNVRRRLELIYPGKHQFEIEQDGIHYSIHLTIQLK